MGRSVRLAIPALVLLLLLAVLLKRWHSTSPVAVSTQFHRTEPVEPMNSIPSRILKAPAPTPGPPASPIPPDPARFLTGELKVRVLSTEGTPVAGAVLHPSLSKNGLFEDKEGVLPDDVHGGSFIHLNGKTPAFSGNHVTAADGAVLLQIAIPREERYLKCTIQMLVEAPGFVRRRNRAQLRLPEQGERKEITFQLQSGFVVRGKILNLEGDDVEQLMIILVPPEEEKEERKSWFALPSAGADGSFESEVAPPIPLLLIVEHLRRKYHPYRQLIHPPFREVQEVVLQRNPDFKEAGRVLFTITNPPPSGKLSHQLRVYSEARKETVGASANSSETKPQKMILKEGAYQVVLMSLEQEQPVWSHASFTVSDSGTTDVPLTLKKSCTVKVRVREKSSGQPPRDKLALFVDYMIGDSPVDMIGLEMGYGKTATDTPGNYQFSTIPAGTVRLRIENGFEDTYKNCSKTVVVNAEEELQLEFLLEPVEK